MNSIDAITLKSEYVPDPHLVIRIDGTPLDSLLASAFPERQLNGLVPTLLDWIDDDRQRQIVWERILPSDCKSSVAPILMCPDDLDFWCTIVVAEISAAPDVIHWMRLGMDDSKREDLPDEIGKNVDWLDGIGPFTFDRDHYSRMLDTFRQSAQPKHMT